MITEDAAGQLYVAGLTSGTIYRISSTPTATSGQNDSPPVKVTRLLADGKVRIETQRPDGTPMLVTLFNVLGSTCSEFKTNETAYEFDISFLPKGVYFLNIVLEGRKQAFKIINE